MLLKLHRRLQLFVVAFAFFNVAFCVDYGTPVDPNYVEEWANMDENNNEKHYNEDHYLYHTYKSEELALFSSKRDGSNHQHQLYSCIKFDDKHFCETSVLEWATLEHYLEGRYISYNIRKIDLATMTIFDRVKRFLIDTTTYQTPYVTFRIKNANYLSFGFIGSTPLPPSDKNFITGYGSKVYYFEDPRKFCDRFLPDADEELTGVNAMKTAFYDRYKGKKNITYAYFFVKGLDTVCWYRFEVNNLGTHANKFQIHSKGMIEYPSDGYAPHFFAFDQNLGGFASLFWTGRREDPPDVHFHIFNENEPEKLSYDGGYSLKGFDPDVRDEIFEGDYDADAYPAFVSFGQQIFVSFTRKGADHEFSGLWSGHNGTPHFIVRRPIDDYQTLVRLRKDYISITYPKKPAERDYVPDPFETTRKAPTRPQTTKSTTTPTPETTTPLTTTSSTTASASTTSEAVSTSISSTHEIPDATPIENYPEDNDFDSNAAAGGGESGDANKDDCVQIPPLWLMILFIVLDVILLIILIILIILTRFGAKKRNAKSAKGKKAKASSSKAAAPIAGTPTTEKSTKKGKSVKAGKTVDTTKYYTVKGKKTAETSKYYTVKNKNKSVEQGTQFFTVDTTFDHTVEKKGSKKK